MNQKQDLNDALQQVVPRVNNDVIRAALMAALSPAKSTPKSGQSPYTMYVPPKFVPIRAGSFNFTGKRPVSSSFSSTSRPNTIEAPGRARSSGSVSSSQNKQQQVPTRKSLIQ